MPRRKTSRKLLPGSAGNTETAPHRVGKRLILPDQALRVLWLPDGAGGAQPLTPVADLMVGDLVEVFNSGGALILSGTLAVK